MIPVPQAEDGAFAIEPDSSRRGAGGHFFVAGGAPGENDLFAGGVRPGDRAENGAGRADRETEELAGRVLDLSVVKDAVTRLHREDDERFAELARYEGTKLGGMVGEHEAFLKSQERKFNASFSDDRQRRLFRSVTRHYFRRSLERARSLRNRMIDSFHRETVIRQNQEFADQALRPENAFDDVLQTGHRDMILYNLENLLDDLPEVERGERLDAAAREFYRKVLEKRLELDPARMRTMLDAPSVRRVLGEKELREFEDKCAAAVRDEELEEAAGRWVAEDADPAEATARAERDFPDAEERKRVGEYYRRLRGNELLRRFLSLAVEIQKAWEAAIAGGCRREAIPLAVRRNRPGMYEFLGAALDRRQDNGGLAPEPDYRRFAKFVTGYSSREALETLSGEKEVFRFIERLGGPDGFAFQAALRLIIGKSTEADRALFRDLAIVLGEAERLGDGAPEKETMNALLQRFVAARRLKLSGAKVEEMNAEEAMGLARGCWESLAAVAEER